MSNYKCRVKLEAEFLSTLKGLTDNFGLRSTFTVVTGNQHSYAPRLNNF